MCSGYFGKIIDDFSGQAAAWLRDEGVCLSPYNRVNRVLFIAHPACNGYDIQTYDEENLE
jgi:hypothetical protein